MTKLIASVFLVILLVPHEEAQAKLVDNSQTAELVIAEPGRSRMVIIVAADAGPWEKRAAVDLAKYIGLMTGANLPIVNWASDQRPGILIGKAAIMADPQTRSALQRVAKNDPVVQADAISVRRQGNRVYIAGSNDESHYFATSWLLQQWGCRWYLPTEFGEVIPRRERLSITKLDHVYAPPFEIRHYSITWNGDTKGSDEFQRRNFMSGATLPIGHTLDGYTHDLVPQGSTPFSVPLADMRTAEHVTAKIESDFAAGKNISLGIADGIYLTASPADRSLGGDYDPYMLTPSVTDAMMTLYNNVVRTLRKKYPESRSIIGGMAYSNATLPPRKVTTVEPNIIMWLAPIDIDPNHAMDDRRSPPRQEYREMMERWSQLLRGHLAIYDYDQGMLVWRDLPDPSHHVFARDVRIYRKAGILGLQTESRGALATTFLNLFFRGQLMWDPDVDVPELLKEFYPGFYGPAAIPMERYWGRIFRAWETTGVTEHEYPVIPAIYTPEVVDALRADLEEANEMLKASKGNPADAGMFEQRMRFTRASFAMIDAYAKTISAAARDADYVAASALGEGALEAKRALETLDPLFVTGLVGVEDSPAWLAGEVRQYAELKALMDGSKGTLVARMPLTWAFKAERPLPAAWRYDGPEGAVPLGNDRYAVDEPSLANGWRTVRTDLYLQAQDVLAPDGQSHLGHYWYRSALEITQSGAGGQLHLMFPGLFNEAWLYVNGALVAHRNYKEPWWRTDYRFTWDVDISRYVRRGSNQIAVRGFNPHHFAGMFRRPFVYRPR